MKNYFSYFFKLLFFSVLLYLLIFCMLSVLYKLPNGRVRIHLRESSSVFEEEGLYPQLMDNNNSQLDNWTDSVMLMTAGYSNYESVFVQAVKNIYPKTPDYDPVATYTSIYSSETDTTNTNKHSSETDTTNTSKHSSESDSTNTSIHSSESDITNTSKYSSESDSKSDIEINEHTYLRYWNGYLLWLKPLLAFFNYRQIRAILAAVQFILFIGVILLLKDRCSRLIFPLAVTYLYFNPVATMISMQFSSAIDITFLALIIMLWKFELLEKRRLFPAFFWMIGLMTNVFDFFTYPLITLGIPLVTYLGIICSKPSLCNRENVTRRKSDENRSAVTRLITFPEIRSITRLSGFWFLGYGLTWVSKWTLGTLVSGQNVFREAGGQVFLRMSDTYETTKITCASVFAENFKAGWNPIIFVILLIYTFIYLYHLVKCNGVCNKNALWILLIAVYPVIWEIVIKSHEYVHFWFTFRILGISLFSIFSFMMLTDSKSESPKKET